jgi:hypothetical protein
MRYPYPWASKAFYLHVLLAKVIQGNYNTYNDFTYTDFTYTDFTYTDFTYKMRKELFVVTL